MLGQMDSTVATPVASAMATAMPGSRCSSRGNTHSPLRAWRLAQRLFEVVLDLLLTAESSRGGQATGEGLKAH